MLRYVIRRILYTLPIFIGVTVVCFALVHLAPGDPIDAVLPENASPSVIAQIKAAYGFDKPLPVQYFVWLGHTLSGNLGMSITSGRPVTAEVGPAVINSLALAAGASVLSIILGCGMGALAGYTRSNAVDRGVSAVTITGVSIPHYWLGMVLIIVFSVELGWLPATGMGDSGANGFSFSQANFIHMILPGVTLAMIPTAIIARAVRAAVRDILKQEFLQTLYAKGLQSRHVFVHVAKNVAPVVMAVMGLQFAQMLGGSILVESVFSWPGTGFLLNQSIFNRDLPVLQGTILVLSMFFVFTNLIVDVLQMFVDPRVKRS